MAQPVKYQSNNQTTSQVSNLQRLWESGGFAITLQLPPPLTATAGAFVTQIAAQATLFDAVLAADAPHGTVALSTLAIAVLLKRLSIETIVQFSGRDRNRLALQSDILSLGALRTPNLLIDMQPLTRASLGHNADARLVTDLDGPALLATAVKLRDEARFISGINIKTPPALYIGALIALEAHIQTSVWESAQFIVTPAVHDAHSFTTELAAFQVAHPDFLQTRPLLVSLPLITEHSTSEVRETSTQKVASAIALLKGLPGVRGFNIVISEHTDLPLLEQIVPRANSNSVGHG